jgi:protein O-mannosyl-transferase
MNDSNQRRGVHVQSSIPMGGRRLEAPAPVALPWWASPRGAAAIVAAAAIAAYARSLGNGFTYDEGLVILGAQRFLQSASFGTLFTPGYFSGSLEGTWRPVCTFTYMLDAQVSMHPAVFKAQSLGWHIGAAWLVMALARRLLPDRHRRYAIVAGLVFALHPVTAETVDNASFREDSLVTVFTLATLILALDGRRKLALLTFALGLLSKESAVMAPALLAVLRLGRFDGQPEIPELPPPAALRARLRALLPELVPFGVVAGLYLGLRFGPMRMPGTYARYPGGTFAATLIGLPAIWAHDIRLLACPWPLCADYTGFFRFGVQPWAPVLWSLVVVLVYLGLAVFAFRRGARLVALGLFWFLLTLLPVSNLVPIPIPAAERFLYLPLVGIALAVTAAFGALMDRLQSTPAPGARRLAVALGVLALGAFAVVLNLRHRDWHDDQTLWLATVAVNPRSCGAQSAVGGALLSRGMASRERDILRASAAREELALSLCTDESDPFRGAASYTRLGAARAMLDDRAGAREALGRATELAPRYALPVAWLGYLAFREGDMDGAAALLKHAIIDLGPPDATVAAVAQLYVDKI